MLWNISNILWQRLIDKKENGYLRKHVDSQKKHSYRRKIQCHKKNRRWQLRGHIFGYSYVWGRGKNAMILLIFCPRNAPKAVSMLRHSGVFRDFWWRRWRSGRFLLYQHHNWTPLSLIHVWFAFQNALWLHNFYVEHWNGFSRFVMHIIILVFVRNPIFFGCMKVLTKILEIWACYCFAIMQQCLGYSLSWIGIVK